MDDIILVGVNDVSVYISVRGKAVHENCLGLKRFFENVFETGLRNLKTLRIDLSRAEFIDSTFLGLMIWAEKHLLLEIGTHLELLSPSPRVREILTLSGLDVYFELREMAIPDCVHLAPLESAEVDRLENAIILYVAHDALSGLDGLQAERYSLVKETLARQIDRLKKVKTRRGRHDG